MTTHAFLAALFAETPGLVELRSVAAPATFLPTPLHEAELGRYLRWLMKDARRKPYFGVATRLVPSSGRYENCAALPALFADCDFEPHGEDTVRRITAEHPYPPSAIVSTGGGLHLYWLLEAPLLDLARAAKILSLWVQTVPVADQSVKDVPRVLRLPGTDNHKYSPARRTAVEVLDPKRRYRIDDLEGFAKASAFGRDESLPDDDLIARPYLLPTTVAKGNRHGEMFRFMRSIQSRYGLEFDEVYQLVRAVNRRRCDPPLSERELRHYLRRGWRAADRTGFDRRGPMSSCARIEVTEEEYQRVVGGAL